jgi:hypothetical protein
MLIFDQFGNLTPDKPIESSFEEIEQTFAFNERRKNLLDKLKSFIDAVLVLGVDVKQAWIDGSWVTKKAFPRDIDTVLFISNEDYSRFSPHLRRLTEQYLPDVDSYFLSIYPENHPLRFWYESDRIDYLHLFSGDRNKRKKGFCK